MINPFIITVFPTFEAFKKGAKFDIREKRMKKYLCNERVKCKLNFSIQNLLLASFFQDVVLKV